MINTDDLCMSCMKEIGDVETCPHCGFNAGSKQISPYLPIRCVIGCRYLIGKLIDYNGDGATYIAWDMGNKVSVMIREFYPAALVSRGSDGIAVEPVPGSEGLFDDYLQSFLEMWNQLKRLRGMSALIPVTDIIETNNTAYAVYENIEGITLRDYLLKSQTGYVSWETARGLFMPVLSTLGTLHSSGIIHRGISPTNLIVKNDGKVCITGFSISEVRNNSGRLTPQLYPGYSAIEQYQPDMRQGTWTDIYSFAAVLYRSLIGSDPIIATSRASNDRLMVPAKFAEQIPAYVINGLINALQILPDDRTHTVDQLRAELSASPVATANTGSSLFTASIPKEVLSSKENSDKKEKEYKTKKGLRSWQITVISFFACIIVCLSAVIFMFGDEWGLFEKKTPETDDVTVTTVATVPVPDFRTDPVTIDRAKQILGDDFEIETKEVTSDDVEQGYVFGQDLEPGTEVKKGSKIVLYVSAGKSCVVLENVEGLNIERAEAILKDFTCHITYIENDGTHVANTVSEMSLTPGNTYETGTEVWLKVYEEAVTEPPTTETTTQTTAEKTTIANH